MTDIRELRESAHRRDPRAVPAGMARSQPFAAQLRAKLVDHQGQQVHELIGYASVVERAYEMWDAFGPYSEVVSAGAFERALDADPDVAFLVNHRGVTMARTRNGTLRLKADDTGLRSQAFLNPKRTDVRDLILAIEDENVTEMSFAFTIPEGGGQWSPDYSEYRINEVDLHRGDVSAVNYGANPYTSVAARSREILDDLDRLPAGAARAAMDRLAHRLDQTPPPAPAAVAPAAVTVLASEERNATCEATGRSISTVRALLEL